MLEKAVSNFHSDLVTVIAFPSSRQTYLWVLDETCVHVLKIPVYEKQPLKPSRRVFVKVYGLSYSWGILICTVHFEIVCCQCQIFLVFTLGPFML